MEVEVDNHKLMYHPERVAQFKNAGDCFPVYVEVGLTNACNHKCIFCALDFLENGGDFMDKHILISNLKYMANNGLKSIMFAGEGEPLLHKDISLFIKKSKEFGLDISVTTNGVLFDEEKIKECLPNLSWIRFSIDAGTPETYAKIHGTSPGDFDKIMNNLKSAVEFRNKHNLKTIIGTQLLMIPSNINEVEILAEKLKNIGVDNLQIKPYSHHPGSINNFSISPSEHVYLKERLMKYNSPSFKILFREETGKRIEEQVPYTECHGLPFFALIDSKGNVIPCNLFYGNPEFTYGNLYENSFSEIWNGEKRKIILQKLREIGVDKCRKGCRLDSCNRYLKRILNPELHDNFI